MSSDYWVQIEYGPEHRRVVLRMTDAEFRMFRQMWGDPGEGYVEVELPPGPAYPTRWARRTLGVPQHAVHLFQYRHVVEGEAVPPEEI